MQKLHAVMRAGLITIAILFGWAVVFTTFRLPASYFSTGLSVITIFFILMFGEKELLQNKKRK